MKKIVVIGGGTAGWITALFASRYFSNSVKVISPSSIDILGAGEGSTPNMPGLFELLGIDIEDFLIKTDATLKLGIKFINWNKEVKGSFDHLFHTSEQTNYGFHFNARKTADYLENYAQSLGVQKVDKVIESFDSDENGNIRSITTSDGEKIDVDFIFDCSGFRRLLIGDHFKSEWKDYSNSLICNKAFGFFLPQHENIDHTSLTKTKATSMSSGWMWQIPLQNRWGCGYVFNDSFISVEDAVKEVEELVGYKIKIEKVFDFNPGVYKKTWINNCASLGLASGFIEPLEATSIMSLIFSLKKLSSFDIFSYDKLEVDEYNEYVTNMSDQVVTFLTNHYRCDRDDTPFWRYIHSKEILGTLKKIKDNKDLDDNKIREIFQKDINDFLIFGQINYQTVDYGHKVGKWRNSLI